MNAELGRRTANALTRKHFLVFSGTESVPNSARPDKHCELHQKLRLSDGSPVSMAGPTDGILSFIAMDSRFRKRRKFRCYSCGSLLALEALFCYTFHGESLCHHDTLPNGFLHLLLHSPLAGASLPRPASILRLSISV